MRLPDETISWADAKSSIFNELKSIVRKTSVVADVIRRKISHT